MRIAIAFVALLHCLTACGAKSGPFTRESALEKVKGEHSGVSLPPDVLPAGVTAHENVAYVRRGSRALELDLYAPAGKGPVPAVLLVHGGGWESGSREMERPFAKRLASLGYVTVPVSYRLGPEGRYPNALHDLKLAVRWLRANAASYAIDPARVGAVGGSAGGQLVALLGATNGMSHFDGEVPPELASFSSDIQALVDIDGLADFTGKALLDKELDDPGAPTRFLGGPYATRAPIWREASAITHAGPKSAPTLFIESGAARPILPGRKETCEKLVRAGVDCERAPMPAGTPHPFWLMNPWFEPSVQKTESFLRKHLATPRR